MIEIPLAEADWARVKHLFPKSESPALRGPGRPRRNVRDILDAILWIQQSGEKWHRSERFLKPSSRNT
ncbi:transposase [Paraburkholderia sp.]|uniref:transposase n=1 Tax=Paraburkholderia sp. TaxID=1926495 RepID=UPI003C7C337F